VGFLLSLLTEVVNAVWSAPKTPAQRRRVFAVVAGLVLLVAAWLWWINSRAAP
jgi:hypothetical protein